MEPLRLTFQLKIALFFLAVLTVILAVLVVAPTLISKKKMASGPDNELGKYAEKILNECSNHDYRPSCYDREIPKLLDRGVSMEEAFQVTRLIQEQDLTYFYCHVLAHNIAENETAKDPSQWKEVMAKCPVTMCNNGCPHGALMERFRNDVDYLTDEQIESIKLDLADVCEPRNDWNPREVERSMCYHALGHTAMYITNADLRKSVQLCREISTKADGRVYYQTCIEGVFMSVYQPLEPEDLALVKDLQPSKDTVLDFCAPFKDDPVSYHACYKESLHLFRDEVITPEGYLKFCSYTKEPDRQDDCFRFTAFIITDKEILDNNNIEGLINFCRKLPEHPMKLCIHSAAHRLMQTDTKLAPTATLLCQSATVLGQEIESSCYDSLLQFSAMGFIKDSAEFYEYCRLLPEPWQERCLNGQWR